MSKNVICLVGESVSEFVLSCLKKVYVDKEFGCDTVNNVAQIYVLGRTNAEKKLAYESFVRGISAAVEQHQSV